MNDFMTTNVQEIPQNYTIEVQINLEWFGLYL